MKQLTITFSAHGQVKQRVTLLKSEISANDLKKGLNSGKYVTTVQEGGEYDTHVEDTSTGEKIARIDNIDNKLEYEDFETNED